MSGPSQPTVTVELPSVQDTHSFGAELGRRLRAGDLVILSGALGAGKTALAKGIGAGMEVQGTIMSPTFVIARVHRPTRHDGVGLVHVDAYRLAGSVELDDLDLDTELANAAVVIEWGEDIAEQLAEGYLHIALHRRPDDVREMVLTAVGQEWARRLSELPVAQVGVARREAADLQSGGQSG